MRLTIEVEAGSDTSLELQDFLQEDPNIAIESSTAPPTSGVTGAEIAVVMFLIVSGAETVNLLSDISYRIWQRFRKPTVIDLTGDEPQIRILEGTEGLRGELFILTQDGERLTREHGASHNDITQALKDLR